MHNVWLMDLRAQPPVIAAHLSSANHDVLRGLTVAAAGAFPGPEFTLVHEVDAEPMRITEEVNARGLAHL